MNGDKRRKGPQKTNQKTAVARKNNIKDHHDSHKFLKLIQKAKIHKKISLVKEMEKILKRLKKIGKETYIRKRLKGERLLRNKERKLG